MHYPELWFKGISNHIQDWRRLAREARRNAQQLTKPYSVIKILLFRCAIFTLPFSLTVDIHAMLWVISLLPHLLCIVSFCLSRNVTLAWWLYVIIISETVSWLAVAFFPLRWLDWRVFYCRGGPIWWSKILQNCIHFFQEKAFVCSCQLDWVLVL